MMANGDVSAKKDRAIRLLISGSSASQIAKDIGVHENTISRWKKEPAFQEALKQAESEALRDISLALLTLAEKATGTLDNVMQSHRSHDSTKVRAADIVLGRLLQIRDQYELEERIDRLEERLNEKS